MDIFQGNSPLEEVVFTGMNYALYSRHNIPKMFTPFMMLQKDGKRRMLRVVVDGDPNDTFQRLLNNEQEVPDQIVMCFEGSISHQEDTQDAVVVKGFDTSQPNGLMFIQRFRGIESGYSFAKLGNPTLVNQNEKLPIPVVARDVHQTSETPSLSGMAIAESTGEISIEITAKHHNPSLLANHLFQATLNMLESNEDNLSGTFIYSLVTDTLEQDDFTQFIFSHLLNDLYHHPVVAHWEKAQGKELRLVIKSSENI